MAKAPAKKMKSPAIMIVVMKKKGNGGGCGHEGESYKKGGMVRKKKGCK